MHNIRTRFLLPGLAVLAVATLAWAVDVSTDYNHHVDFAKYHTYSWIGVRAGNSLWQDRIMSAVDSALAAHGWQKVPSGGDAAVSAFGRTSEQETLQTYYDAFPGWGWGGWDGMSTTTAVPEAVGNLTVDIFDGNTKQLIWRGTSAHSISPGKPEKNEHKLDEGVNKMFKHFPPAPKG
jgi:hypothetical protein